MSYLFAKVEFQNHRPTTRAVFFEPGCESVDVPGHAHVALDVMYHSKYGFVVEIVDDKVGVTGNLNTITVYIDVGEVIRATVDGIVVEL